MSLSRLASQHVARTTGAVRAQSAVAAPDADDRFDLLTKYIPTETITLFVAAMSAADAIREAAPGIGPWTIYWAGAALTPIILLLAAYGKQRVSGAAAPFRPHPWPYAASVIAFLVWALSVPGLLDPANEGRKILAAFAALLVSTGLALLESAVGPRP